MDYNAVRRALASSGRRMRSTVRTGQITALHAAHTDAGIAYQHYRELVAKTD